MQNGIIRPITLDLSARDARMIWTEGASCCFQTSEHLYFFLAMGFAITALKRLKTPTTIHLFQARTPID